MELLKLTLNNFKGIRHLEVNPNGKSISIYGDNGTGKTTIADAQFWLLFGKDSVDTKNFVPKPKEDGTDVHDLESWVEGVYRLEYGTVITLCKKFSEVWKKKRGYSTAVFSGHTKEHFIDGVPVKESEYIDRLSKIANMETMMVLSSVSYFSDIVPPADRRRILLDVVGDFCDEDVLSGNPELKDLHEFLRKPNTSDQYYTVEEYHKLAKSRMTEINKQLQLLPARIDEAQKAIPEEFDAQTLEREMKSLTSQKNKLLNQLHSSQSERIADLQTRISTIQVELLDAESAHKKKYMDINQKVEDQLKSIRSELQVAQLTKQRADQDKIRLGLQLKEMEIAREKLLKEYTQLSHSVWNGNTICPTCGQDIPEDQIAEKQRQWKLQKSRDLEVLNHKGKETCSKEMIAELHKKIEEEATISERESEKITGLQSDVEHLEADLTSEPPFSETDIYREIIKKKEILSAQIEEIRSDDKAAQTAVQIQIDDVDEKLKSLLQKKAAAEQSAGQKARVAELEQEQKQYGKEYEQCSKGISLCEAFIRAKVSMLTDRINRKFQNVQFRLFETQINGGVKETCETLVPSASGFMPYSYANHAARVNAGLDIIRVLSAHYGVTMPVFVDNAESVTELKDDGLQVIRLVVSEKDKTLRVEE